MLKKRHQREQSYSDKSSYDQEEEEESDDSFIVKDDEVDEYDDESGVDIEKEIARFKRRAGPKEQHSEGSSSDMEASYD